MTRVRNYDVKNQVQGEIAATLEGQCIYFARVHKNAANNRTCDSGLSPDRWFSMWRLA